MPISFIKDYQTSDAYKYRENMLKNKHEYKEVLLKSINMLITVVARRG
ncbi:hypothetical protein ACGTJS_10995 [Faucicola mancuniensis]